MKKNIFFALGAVLVVGAMFVGATSASAAVCGDGTLGTVVCGNGNPELVTNGFGVTNSQVPHVKPGQSYTAYDGSFVSCPAWYFRDCLDVTGTEVYKTGARETARQLQSNGWLSSFPMFAYWLTH